ncbi:flagellar motor switch protein FliN [bacterium]|nr:flagellar motor switch protein FliN [bacterium]MBU1983821.1 flagellar motor switch protein FliN [bacterium]
MGNLLLNNVLDQQIEQAEEAFRATLEETLRGFLEREVPVQAQGPEEFEFKEFKASLPGEVVVVNLTATDGGPGKVLFVLSRETAGKLGDLLLLGDGSATFSHEEHLEPVRDMFREVMASFASNLGLKVGHRIAFEEIKASLVDLTPSDFVGTGWMTNRFEIGLESPETIFKMVSLDFWEACFPDVSAPADSEEMVHEEVVDHSDVGKEMGLVLDIELPLSIELGRTSMLIRDIIKLAPGSIVELDKLSGEPVDLLVNGRLFGRGEVVVVEENFAVRLTEIVSPHDLARVRRN